MNANRSVWHVLFALPDTGSAEMEWTGNPNLPEHRIAWALQGMAERHFGKRVFSVKPVWCTGLVSGTTHMGAYCPVHGTT